MKKIAYYFSFIPFQLNFFVLLFIAAGTFTLVQNEYVPTVEKTYFIMLLKALALFTMVFSIMIVGIAFATTFLSWVYFWIYKRAQKESPIQASVGEGEKAQAGYVALGMKAKGIIKPLLGHVKGRIVFSDKAISPALALDQPVFGKGKFIRSALKAGRPVWIPDIKEHEVKNVVLYFEDMFRLFSFPFVLTNVQKLLTVPAESDHINVTVHPDKTIDQDQRIETPKRVQGELFNYKNFESGDDIRRIVWKIYAKNKDLVVKIPETMDPYASHIYFHPSFYSTDMASIEFKKAMLNYYKIKIRQLFEALGRGEFTVKYIPDQELATPDTIEDDDPVWLYQLTTSAWQSLKESTDNLASKKEGIYCISSLMPVEDVEEILTNKSPETLVFFVKVSRLWQNRRAFNLLSLLMKTDEHPLNVLKRRWLFSSSRKRILNNEKRIEQYLNDQLFKNIIL
jgi:hypothetical protein